MNFSFFFTLVYKYTPVSERILSGFCTKLRIFVPSFNLETAYCQSWNAKSKRWRVSRISSEKRLFQLILTGLNKESTQFFFLRCRRLVLSRIQYPSWIVCFARHGGGTRKIFVNKRPTFEHERSHRICMIISFSRRDPWKLGRNLYASCSNAFVF